MVGELGTLLAGVLGAFGMQGTNLRRFPIRLLCFMVWDVDRSSLLLAIVFPIATSCSAVTSREKLYNCRLAASRCSGPFHAGSTNASLVVERVGIILFDPAVLKAVSSLVEILLDIALLTDCIIAVIRRLRLQMLSQSH